jgi:hypothetical protein
MKFSVLVLATSMFVLGLNAMADDGHRWFCTADGYDQNNQIRSISGRLMPTQKLAERSAVQSCQGFYMGCRVRSCFQQR